MEPLPQPRSSTFLAPNAPQTCMTRGVTMPSEQGASGVWNSYSEPEAVMLVGTLVAHFFMCYPCA